MLAGPMENKAMSRVVCSQKFQVGDRKFMPGDLVEGDAAEAFGLANGFARLVQSGPVVKLKPEPEPEPEPEADPTGGE